jgi:ANTAR domain
MISKVVHEAACPVITLLESSDPAFVNEAAKRGVFAYITDGDSQQLQSTLEIVLRRFAEYHNLEGAFARRATIERAKGILMAIHGLDEQQAFDMLRSHSQRSGRRLLRPRRSRHRQPPTPQHTRRARKPEDHALGPLVTSRSVDVIGLCPER